MPARWQKQVKCECTNPPWCKIRMLQRIFYCWWITAFHFLSVSPIHWLLLPLEEMAISPWWWQRTNTMSWMAQRNSRTNTETIKHLVKWILKSITEYNRQISYQQAHHKHQFTAAIVIFDGMTNYHNRHNGATTGASQLVTQSTRHTLKSPRIVWRVDRCV